MSDEWVMVPRDLLQRVDAALQRHLDRHAPMRIPVDQTDSDLVQSDVQALITAPAAPQQAEPVGYFVNDESDDQWHQVDYEQRNGADTYPLYLHPPADEVQQAEPAGEVARIGCHYAMLPDHVCNKCGRIHGYSHPHAAYLRGVDEGKRQAAAPQQAEPVAQIGWADEFGNLFPMGAWKPAQRTHHDSHKTAWRAVYLHPPAAEVQRLKQERDGLKNRLEWRHDGGPDGISARDETIKMQDAEVRRLQEALKPFAAIALTTNQAVDAMDVLRARRALEGGE